MATNFNFMSNTSFGDKVIDFGKELINLIKRNDDVQSNQAASAFGANLFDNPENRSFDPIRATYQLGPQYNNEIIQERESGQVFTPNAAQLQSFMDGMEAASQPSVVGVGPGGSRGLIFGGGEAPLSIDETRALLQERFGAPTISAIEALPEGEGLGLRVDPQGRMISQEMTEVRLIKPL